MGGETLVHVIRQETTRECCVTDCNRVLYAGSTKAHDYSQARAYVNYANTHLLRPRRKIPQSLRADLLAFYHLVIDNCQSIFVCDICAKRSISSFDRTSFRTFQRHEQLPDSFNDILYVHKRTQQQLTAKTTCEKNAHVWHQNVDNAQYATFTGYTKQQLEGSFNQLQARADNLNLTESLELTSISSKIPQILLLVFTIIRHALSFSFAATLFGYQSPGRVGELFIIIIRAFRVCFVPLQLGYEVWTRSRLLENSLECATILFGSSAPLVVLDGTYLFIQKSGLFNDQCRSYCKWKGQNCLMPMIVCTLNGLFVNLYGPFWADGKNSDSRKLQEIVDKPEKYDLMQILKPDDIALGDRGFQEYEYKQGLIKNV